MYHPIIGRCDTRLEAQIKPLLIALTPSEWGISPHEGTGETSTTGAFISVLWL